MQKPKIAILATGGTIAGRKNINDNGYRAGVVGINELISTIPNLKNLEIHTEQIANIDSADMSSEIWLKLAKKINELPNVEGIVITHGTDTLEESAYFLSLVVNTNKPIVLVGAMRPFDEISADGARNLYCALILASSKEAQGRGVMIVMNDRILSARGAVKTHTLNTDSFLSPDVGDLGYMLNYKPLFFDKMPKIGAKFDINALNALPKVDILYTYSDDGSAVAARAFVENGAKGLVVASSGAGSIHKTQKEALVELIKKGVFVVVSKRVLAGCVALSSEDLKLGFISAFDLNPQKARILLSLAIANNCPLERVRAYFSDF